MLSSVCSKSEALQVPSNFALTRLESGVRRSMPHRGWTSGCARCLASSYQSGRVPSQSVGHRCQ